MSDYAFFTGVTGVQWTVLTLPSQGDPQVSLDDDGTVSVSGDFHASVSYSYPDPVTGAAVPQTDDEPGSYNATVSLTSSPPSVTWQ